MTHRRTRLLLALSALTLLTCGIAYVSMQPDADRAALVTRAALRGSAEGAIDDAIKSDIDASDERERRHVREPIPKAPKSTPVEEKRSHIEPRIGPESTERARAVRQAAHDAIESVRDDIHRDKMNVIWPTAIPPPPPDGAEIVVLGGYMDYTLAKISWRDGVATGAWLEARRSWFYNREGERLSARSFTVDPELFQVAWSACRLVLGARAERKVPLPDGRLRGGRFGFGSHSPYLVARLRSSPTEEVHQFEQRGSRSDEDGVRRWGQTQDRAIHRLLDDLVASDAPEAPLSIWLPFLNASLAEAGAGADVDRGSAGRLVLEVTLRVIGDAGDARSLALLHTLAAQLPGDDEIPRARVRLELRLGWSAERAEEVIVTRPRPQNGDRDLAAWVHALWLEREPAEYREMLQRRLSDGSLSAPLVSELQDALEQAFPEAAVAVQKTLLGHDDAAVRVRAAIFLADRGEPAAVRVLEAMAMDRDLRRAYWVHGPWPRSQAIEHLLRLGEWQPNQLRGLLGEPGEDGRLVSLIVDWLDERNEPLTTLERRDAYRGALEGPAGMGTLEAIARLVELDDRSSFERMGALLDDLEPERAEGDTEIVSSYARRNTIPKLREALHGTETDAAR